ncbi:unnamed protein product [Pipistrellus nathusii]|uniref:Uncharacterized protein n=1 Tax=Pipistrellus nathusii TaxID=59473 RepID=A0ABP0A3X9_PIPNA
MYLIFVNQAKISAFPVAPSAAQQGFLLLCVGFCVFFFLFFFFKKAACVAVSTSSLLCKLHWSQKLPVLPGPQPLLSLQAEPPVLQDGGQNKQVAPRGAAA